MEEKKNLSDDSSENIPFSANRFSILLDFFSLLKIKTKLIVLHFVATRKWNEMNSGKKKNGTNSYQKYPPCKQVVKRLCALASHGEFWIIEGVFFLHVNETKFSGKSSHLNLEHHLGMWLSNNL